MKLMLSVLQQRITTVAGIVVTSILTLLSFLFNILYTLPFQVTWLTFVIGTMITVTTTLLEMRLADIANREIGRRLELYSLIEQVEKDDALRIRAMEIVDRCESQLQNIAQGILSLDREEFIKYITDKMNSTPKGQEVWAIHIATELSDMRMWENDPGIVNYFLANITAAKKGVKITRIFVLKKDMLIDSETKQQINPWIIEIIRRHSDALHDVRVILDENLRDDLRSHEFMIFNHREVQLNLPRVHGKYYELSLTRKQSTVNDYIKRFGLLRVQAEPLGRFLARINAS